MQVPALLHAVLQETFEPSAATSLAVWLAFAVLILFVLAAMWRVFEKAGEHGWAALIPIYNAFVLLRIARKPMWWFLLLLIPIVNIVVGFMMTNAIARNFGKGTGFALGLVFLGFIFYPILAFGDAVYSPTE
jgi:hypothetical protein